MNQPSPRRVPISRGFGRTLYGFSDVNALAITVGIGMVAGVPYSVMNAYQRDSV